MMPNPQYNALRPDSFPIRIANRQRRVMYDRFVAEVRPAPEDTILDVGATSDDSYESSNYLEAWYPRKVAITACGVDDASFLEARYPGMRFVPANGLDLCFPDRSFDIVHSSAVLEHVGSAANQRRFVQECVRVARRAVFITTPNRWFPVEPHTSLPLLHWLPKPVFRSLLRHTRLAFFAAEANLNLVSAREASDYCAAARGFRFTVRSVRLGGWASNLLLCGHRDD
jgi:hypothetical protein